MLAIDEKGFKLNDNETKLFPRSFNNFTHQA